jgi:hypothetical protein
MKTENTSFSKSILARNQTLQQNAEKRGSVHIFLVITLYIVFAVFTYAPDYGWWISLLGSAIMLIVGKLAFAAEWRSKLGLAVPKREIAIAAIVAAALGFVFALFIFRQLELSQLAFFWWWERNVPFYHLHTCAQVFNEELALGGIPILWFAKKLRSASSSHKSANPNVTLIAAACLFAFVFSLLHFALYAWSPFVPKSTVELSVISFFSLCCVGILRNLLIVWRGHIAFALALHLAWNSIFFGGMVLRENAQVNETELFNLTLGNPTFAVLLASVTVAVLFVTLRNTNGANSGTLGAGSSKQDMHKL